MTLGSRGPMRSTSQTGTKRMPRRPEVALTEAFKRGVMHHVQVYLVQIATQSGFRQGLGPITAAKLGGLRAGLGSATFGQR